MMSGGESSISGGREDLAFVAVVIDQPPLRHCWLSLAGPGGIYLKGLQRRLGPRGSPGSNRLRTGSARCASATRRQDRRGQRGGSDPDAPLPLPHQDILSHLSALDPVGCAKIPKAYRTTMEPCVWASSPRVVTLPDLLAARIPAESGADGRGLPVTTEGARWSSPRVSSSAWRRRTM